MVEGGPHPLSEVIGPDSGPEAFLPLSLLFLLWLATLTPVLLYFCLVSLSITFSLPLLLGRSSSFPLSEHDPVPVTLELSQLM